MMVFSTFRNRLFALLRSTSGNFGMMTALLLPVSVGIVGLGLDVTNMIQDKRTLQNALDSAALATATAMTNDISQSDAETMAKSFVTSQMANILSDAKSASANLTTTTDISTTTPSSGGKVYDVALTGSYTMSMNALSQALGWKTVTIKAYGKAEASSNSASSPLSMYLVLDRSGSMNDETSTSYTGTCQNSDWEWDWKWGWRLVTTNSPCTQYYTKIESLKLAVQSLAAQLKTADPDNTFVRTGADSYNDVADTPTPMTWGTAKTQDYVDALIADGGTDATDALDAAYKALRTKNNDEEKAHSTSDFKRYVVFMTDGEMTGDSNRWNSTIDAQVRKKCTTIKKDGIEIYTIAFSAPDKGKSLLSACASDSDHYYEATDSASLVSAFGDIGKKAIKSSTRLTN